ncbi:MAG: oligopeptide ABC transporter permease OppB, partial [Steroidobacteraceae bacterium]|nr:oligopeptide ABC transporter permease OppB [Steroidobacteraceae bacterium]
AEAPRAKAGDVLRYAVRRILGIVPTLLVIITVSFFVIRLAPGGPFDEEQTLPPEIRANLEAAYGLDQPIWRQYLRYMSGLARGDFGPSFKFKDFTVTELIAQGLPISLTVGLSAVLLGLLVGVPLGTCAALRQNTWIDTGTMALVGLGVSIPSFVVAPVLQILFGLHWRVLPVAGWESGDPRYFILPVLTLSFAIIAYVGSLTRGSMIEVLNSHFVRTARAKGLPEYRVVLRHALRPTLLPVVSWLGPAVAFAVTGSLIVETVFGLPGSGRYLVQGAINRDYSLVMGMIIVYGSLIVLCNLLADLLYGWLDPRVRYV